MIKVVYVLCAGMSFLCALLLYRGYRQRRTQLLFWSSLCFVGLAFNNLLLVLDLMFISSLDLSLVRPLPGLIGVVLLLYGFIFHGQGFNSEVD